MDLHDGGPELLARADLLHLRGVRLARLLEAEQGLLGVRVADDHVLAVPVDVVAVTHQPPLSRRELVPDVEHM